MSRTAAQAQEGVLSLVPDGFVFSRDVDDYEAALELATAKEWSLVEQTMESFEDEIDPGTAEHLLPDYLRVLGPDPYGRDELTLSSALRSLLAHQRWVDAPIICPGYFVQSAAELGIAITITEYELPVCGEAVCGDTLMPWLQQCVFLVTLPTDLVWDATCGDCVCGDTMGGFTPSVLENFITQKAPLYTRPVFNYT
jgi:uncharacterized protein YmfQ (DUF2313 family)